MPLMSLAAPDRLPEPDSARVVRLARLVRQLAEVVATLSERVDRLEVRD